MPSELGSDIFGKQSHAAAERENPDCQEKYAWSLEGRKRKSYIFWITQESGNSTRDYF